MRRDRRGAVALLVALSMLPLLGLCGIAVDAMRGWLLHSRLIAAVDAATLAGGRNMTTLTTAQRDAQIRGIFWANFGYQGLDPNDSSGASRLGFLGSSARDPTITASSGTVQVTAEATIPATFLRLFGQTTITTSATATVSGSTEGLEVALVLDVTGSMLTNNNYKALRTAATNLVNILFGNQETQPNLWVSVVPYVTTVNVGPDHDDWLVKNSLKSLSYPKGYGWRGCVEMRWQNGYDLNDAPPSEMPFTPYYWASTKGVYKNGNTTVTGDNDWTASNINEDQQDTLFQNWVSALGPNLGCPLMQILPHSTSRTAILDSINRTFPTIGGGTMTPSGLQAGWFTLSPRWQGLWGNATLPLPYGTPGMRKVLVVFTDGDNNGLDLPGAPGALNSSGKCCQTYTGQRVDGDYSGYGRFGDNRLGIRMPVVAPGSSGSAYNTAFNTADDRLGEEINRHVSLLCTNIKNAGIQIYTITFGSLTTATTTLYRNCASSSANYFNAPTQAALLQAFQQIGTQLSSLRLTR